MTKVQTTGTERISDSDLLAAYLDRGSEKAFTVLVQRYSKVLYSTCLRKLGNDHARAEDAVQVVFTLLAEKAEKLRGRDNIIGWLYRTANYTAASLWRKEQTQRRVKESMKEEASVEADMGPVNTLWEKIRGELDDIIQALPGAQQEALVLHYLHGVPQVDLASQLGCSRHTVNSRLRLALEKIRKSLSTRGIIVATPMLVAGFELEGQVSVPAGCVERCVRTALDRRAPGVSEGGGGHLVEHAAGGAGKTLTGKLLATLAIVGVGTAVVAPFVMDRTESPSAVVSGEAETPGKYEGSFFKRFAELYESKGLALMSQTYRDGRTLFDFDAKALLTIMKPVTPESSFEIVTMVDGNRTNEALKITTPATSGIPPAAYVSIPADVLKAFCVSFEAQVSRTRERYGMTFGTAGADVEPFVPSRMPARARPLLPVKGPRKSGWIQYRMEYLHVGHLRDDGMDIYEVRAIFNGKPRKCHWLKLREPRPLIVGEKPGVPLYVRRVRVAALEQR